MYTSHEISPIIRNNNFQESYSNYNSSEIFNIKNFNENLINIIYPQNKITFQEENSLIPNKILNNYNSEPYMTKSFQIPNFKKKKFEENKSSIYYLQDDGSFTRLIGEVSSSYMKKIKEYPKNQYFGIKQNKSKLSKYLIKNPDIKFKRRRSSIQNKNNENLFNKSLINKLRKNENKCKSTEISIDKNKSVRINIYNKNDNYFYNENEYENGNYEINQNKRDLSKGGVVNLNLNQVKKKIGERDYIKDENKIIFLQHFFRQYINIKKGNIKYIKYHSYSNIEKFTQKLYKLIFKEKKNFLNKLLLQKRYFQMKLIKNNLNYHKPIVKQKRKEDSITSLNHISNYFPPSNSEKSIHSLKENLNSKNYEVFKFNDNNKSSFLNLQYSNQNSFFFQGEQKLKRISIKDFNEEINYKKLYEESEENLNQLKKKNKNFGFLYIKKKVNNIHFNAIKNSSFKNIEMDFPEEGDFYYEGIKKKLVMKKLNNIQIKGIKKNQYLWVKLPLAIKNLLQKYINKQNCKLFFNNLKKIYLIKKKEEKLIKNFQREENKILKKYFSNLKYKILKITDNENLKREKMNKLFISKEINIEIERDIINKSFHSDSFFDMNEIKLNDKINLNISFENKRKNIKKLKLESIPKIRKIYKFKNKARSASRSSNKIKKELEKKERKRTRTLHYIDKNNSRNNSNSNKKFKQIKIIKKIYDNITGNIHQIKVKLNKSNNNIYDNIIEQSNIQGNKFAEFLLNEDKNSKMKRLIEYKQKSHFFHFWKNISKNKILKPKFYDIILIMMKCLFNNNNFIKNSFMGEIFFIKGKYLLQWYWNTVKNNKKKGKKKKKSVTFSNI